MKKLLLCAFLLFPIGSALAQPAPVEVITGGIPVSGSNPFPISGSFSATLSGWPGTTQTTGTPIAVTTGGVSGTLPTGTVVLATNVGSNTAYCKLGASATTSDTPIFANSSVAFTVGTNTQLTCITLTSTTTVNMSGGSGLPTGWGGGGTGGGGGAVNITQIASSTNGITTWGTAPTGASVLGVNANVLSAAPNTTATGNITSTQTVVITPTSGQSTIGIQVTGTWTGTLFVEASVDGTNFVQTTTVPVTSGSVQVATITANGVYQANGSGFASFRIRGNTVATGTAVVTLIASAGTANVMMDNPAPVTGYAGMVPLNVVGNTAIGSATTDKPVMIGGTSTGASGGNAQVAKVSASGLVSVDGSAVTQPVSAASLPLPTGAATAAGQTAVQGTVAPGTAAANSQLGGCVYNSSAPTLTTGQGVAEQCDVNGNKKVTVTNTNANVGGGSPVTNGADNWNTIAASQTSQKLSATSGGTTGATGDYLSHCTIQPTTTAAGTVTIADLTTTIYTFTSGTLSNLVPFTIPVGAISKNGAWEVTTGTNVTVTCVGHFS